MNIKDFINNNYKNAINLKKAFQITENSPWDATTVLLELIVQLGHISLIVENNNSVYEIGRKISDLGDEISDVFLQTFALCWKLDINLLETFNEEDCGSSINDMLSIVGQITETVMEKYDFRHKKNREGFDNIDDFLIYKINCLFNVVFNFGLCYNLNMQSEFERMLNNAHNFLRNYKGE